MTALLYKAAPSSIPLCTSPKLHRLIGCSYSSSSAALGGSPTSPEPWRTLLSQQDSSPAAQRMKEVKKRLQIAGVDQDELLDPWLLADADSRFAELHGVHIHYKVADPTCEVEEAGKREDGSRLESLSASPSLSSTSSNVLQMASSSCRAHPLTSSSSPVLPIAAFERPTSSASNPDTLSSETKATSLTWQGIPGILLHGFGASLFSWERVLRPLAKVLGSQALAFDRPAFGLTTRIEVPVGHPATQNGDLPLNPYSVSFSSHATIAFIDFLKANKAVLFGHSAGCIIAADAYFGAPERIAAIVMVAPALVAPVSLYRKAEKQEGEPEKQQENNKLSQLFSNIWAKIRQAFSMIGALAQALLSSIKLLWYRLLAAMLRSDFGRWLIRLVMDKLSLKAVRLAWYDKEKVDDYVISGYTKPLRCRDWERALLEYVIALAGSPSSDDQQVPLSNRISEIKCPVLVITGDSDFIVPAWNAERVAKVLPNAQCHVIKNCGHLPQEEKPEEFLSVIKQFLQRVRQGDTIEKTQEGSMVFMPA